MAEPVLKEELSPEEKLLKVIQGGDQKDGEAEGSDAQPAVDSAEPATEAVPAPAASEDKPKLKLAEEPGTSEPQEEPAEEPAEDAVEDGGKGAGKKAKKPRKGKKKPAAASAAGGAAAASDVGKRMPSEAGTGIRVANRCLIALIVVLLCLCAFEIWSGALATTEAHVPDGVTAPATDRPDFVLPDVTLLQKAFEKKPIWDVGEEEIPPGPKPDPKPPPGPQIEKILKLIGTSAPPGAPPESVTAVILDNRDGKMHFVKIGEKLPFNGHQFGVKNVALDHVVLVEDEIEVTIR